MQRSRNGGTGVIEAWLRAQAQNGWLDIEDADEVAGMLIGMVIGEPHILMLLGQREAPDAAEIQHRTRQAVAIFLGGTLRQGNAWPG